MYGLKSVNAAEHFIENNLHVMNYTFQRWFTYWSLQLTDCHVSLELFCFLFLLSSAINPRLLLDFSGIGYCNSITNPLIGTCM